MHLGNVKTKRKLEIEVAFFKLREHESTSTPWPWLVQQLRHEIVLAVDERTAHLFTNERARNFDVRGIFDAFRIR